MDSRFRQQLDFIIEIDKVKSILRQTRLVDGSRRENDAEHAWHICVMAMIFSEYANDKSIDLTRVIKMLLIHDLVEIDAGDIVVYDKEARSKNQINEKMAAERIFGLLPKEQRDEMMSLWLEFEARETSEAKFAAALDRVQPVLLNYLNKGSVWKKHRVVPKKALEVNATVEGGSNKLWDCVRAIVSDGQAKGYFSDT